jgi:hypothetical protein
MPSYQWLSFIGARQALASRLAVIWSPDPSNNFWSDTELGVYIVEALRTWSALTEQWNADFVFSPTPSQVWYNVDKLPGSPRVRTITDTELYTSMEYMLLEPPTGGTWTGTSQFSIADLSGALQRRRDEMIQETGCNLSQLPVIATTPNTRRVFFPDSTLEPRRARWVPATGSPQTLNREDSLGWDSFEASHFQKNGTPYSWSVITGPPLAMDVDIAPNVSGGYDVLSLQAGASFAPPTATLLNVPDDWSWLPKWGALADLLGRDSEATDRQRADYCLKRYQQGLEVMKESNWLLTALINGIPVDTPSVKAQDGFSAEWENDTSAWKAVVTAGTDLCAVCPVPAIGGPISFIGAVTGTVMTTGFNVPLTLAYNSSTGNTLIMFTATGGQGGGPGIVTSISDSAGNSWQLAGSLPGPGFQCWYVQNAKAITSVTVTFTGDAAITGYIVGLSEYSNVVAIINVQAPFAEQFGNPETITQNIQFANDVIVVAFNPNGGGPPFTPSTGSLRWQETDVVNATMCSADNTAANAGASVTVAVNGPGAWFYISVELQAAPFVPGSPSSVLLTLVGNCPVPVNDNDFVQVSRDVFDIILDYAQVLASFKMGGAEFTATQDLEKNFFTSALATNKRLAKMGVFADMLHLEGNRQDIDQPR